MKWGSKTKHGDTRILKKYAWFPIRIRTRWGNPEVEWRWLEQVKIQQEYSTGSIHDFSIMDQTCGIDYTDTMLNAKSPQIFFIVPVLDAANAKQIDKVVSIYQWANSNNYKFYALTSASAEPAKQFCLKYKLPFEFFASDQKMLMTMARYNPTLYLFDGATVKDKWSGNHIPAIGDLQSYLK